jgi:hypothetical protein
MNADKTYAVDGISCFENVPEHHDPVEPYFGPELPAGDLLDGRSAIAETLSRSGMATIYHARDLEQANQIVAVKVPHLRLEAEPERWVKARAEERQAGVARPLKLMELFAPGLLRATLVGSGLAFVAVFGLWGATNWTPTLIRALPDLQGMNASELTSRVSYATMLPNVGALAGYLSFGPLADRVGRRWVFALMCVGSLVMLPVTFLTREPTTTCCCCCRCWVFSTTAFSAAFRFTSRNCIPRGFARPPRGFVSTSAACWRPRVRL